MSHPPTNTARGLYAGRGARVLICIILPQVGQEKAADDGPAKTHHASKISHGTNVGIGVIGKAAPQHCDNAKQEWR